jgi:hypothetical protein
LKALAKKKPSSLRRIYRHAFIAFGVLLRLHAKQAFVAFFAPRFATFGMQFGDKKQEAKQASRRR